MLEKNPFPVGQGQRQGTPGFSLPKASDLSLFKLDKKVLAHVCNPVILATWEAEIRRVEV
jgi:hypothetical protein